MEIRIDKSDSMKFKLMICSWTILCSIFFGGIATIPMGIFIKPTIHFDWYHPETVRSKGMTDGFEHCLPVPLIEV